MSFCVTISNTNSEDHNMNYPIPITYHHYGYGRGCANENGRGKTCLGSRVTGYLVSVMPVGLSFMTSLFSSFLFSCWSSLFLVGRELRSIFCCCSYGITSTGTTSYLRTILIGLIGPLMASKYQIPVC
eukprot:scaffold189266_cov52-Attheya_sp.AAC.2